LSQKAPKSPVIVVLSEDVNRLVPDISFFVCISGTDQMAGIIRFWNSPNKPTNSSNNSINNNNNSREPVNGIGSDPRGIKRKAKPDPYEAMDEGEQLSAYD
jgi:hypothetical protein